MEQKKQAPFSLLQVAAKLLQVQPTVWVSVTLRGTALAGGRDEGAPDGRSPSAGGTASSWPGNSEAPAAPPPEPKAGEGAGSLLSNMPEPRLSGGVESSCPVFLANKLRLSKVE